MADIKISDFTTITEISEAYVPVAKNGENYKVLLPEAIPSKTSELSNDSGFVTNAVGDLANYYLKTQTYTKDEVQALIGQITTINFEVVSTLPATGASNLIYLVPKAGSGKDVHDEYIWVDGKWELIGNTQVDLTNYYTKAEADGKFALSSQIPTELPSPNRLQISPGDPLLATRYYDGSSAVAVWIPTKTSNLTNDSNYVSRTVLDNALSGKVNNINGVGGIAKYSTDEAALEASLANPNYLVISVPEGGGSN